MSHIRDFTDRERPTVARNLEDAPQEMRQELIDLFFRLVEHLDDWRLFPRGRLYQIISQSLGVRAAAEPRGDFRDFAGQVVERVEWPRVYDLISRLWVEYSSIEMANEFREGVNRILAGYGSAWELVADGRLQRVLPVPAQEQVEATFAELRAPGYAAALALFRAATDAYNDQPRRDRDACTNMFDAMEAAAKEKYQMRNAALDAVLDRARRANDLNPRTIAVLNEINILRHQNFGHGMAFNFDPAEVDFIYLTCVGGILLFTRMQRH